jgi:hypothetical protein
MSRDEYADPAPHRPSGAGSIEFIGGVNRDGTPFVHLLNDGKKFGQLDPGEAIRMGTRAIQAGIEAERDAGVVRALRKVGVDDANTEKAIAATLTMIREERDQADPDPKYDVRRRQ